MKKSENSWTVSGEYYEKNKRKLKIIYGKNGFVWKGNFFFSRFLWVNERTQERIEHTYDRENEVTVKATITVKLSNVDMLKKVRELLEPGVVKPSLDELLQELDQRFKGRMKNLKHDAERGKTGAAVWLKMVEDDYEQQRRKIDEFRKDLEEEEA